MAGNRATVAAIGELNRAVPAPRVQRKESSVTPTTLVDAGVTVSSATGVFNQVGHAMDIWVDLDAGKNPAFGPQARANSVYGLELEYWELIDVPQDNQGGTGVKPWSDIYALKPDAGTFNRAAQGCDLTWKQAVDQAKAQTLRGRHRVGFQDVPGLIPNAGRNVKRTLKFRIVLNDGGNRKEIFATQQLEMKNGKMGYAAYSDSLNNQVETFGFGRQDYDQNKQRESDKLGARSPQDRVVALAVPSNTEVLAAVPTAARQLVQTFVAKAAKGTADPYMDLELLAVLKSIPTAAPNRNNAEAGNTRDWTNLAAELAGDVPGGVGAGQFGIPTIPGTKRYQMQVPGAGVLVALATKNDVKRVYYTDGTTKAITTGAASVHFAAGRTFNLRSFAEIPSEVIQESLGVSRTVGAVLVNPKAVKLIGKEAAHLRAFSVEQGQIVVDVKKTIGAKIKSGEQISVVMPEVRDASGDWIKVRSKGKTGFVRAAKVEGAASKTGWEELEKGEFKDTGGNGAMADYFGAYFKQHGTGHSAYGALLAEFPGLVSVLDGVYAELESADRLNRAKRQLETDVFNADITSLKQMVTTHTGNGVAFAGAMMKYLKQRPGQGDDVERVYNDHVAPDAPAIPATLGELVNSFFVAEFTRDKGSTYGRYNRLKREYPDFDYRLNPAFRQVHGQKKLDEMIGKGEKAAAKKDIPLPGGAANQHDKAQFLAGGPLKATDFVPTTRAGYSRFDADFDPVTRTLDLTVRVYFDFADNTTGKPEDVSQEPAAFNKGFGRKTWTDQEKADWKRDFEPGATGPFNNSGYKLRCTRPGWEDIVVTPRFGVEEVPLGTQHFVVRAVKAVLETKFDQKVLKGIGGSSIATGDMAGQQVPIATLQEYDIYDKLRDPRLHDYLHEGERPHFDEAYNLDHRRLSDLLARLGVLGPVPTRSAVRNLADGLNRLEIPSSLAGQHPVVVTGTSTQSVNAGQQAAQAVVDRLTAAGVPNAVQAGGAVGSADSVVVTAKDLDASIKAQYKAQWSRFTAAHEYGHMIGLTEEYYGAQSGRTVKEMISAGWLPPATRGDHLKLEPPKDVSEQVDQQMSLSVARRAGVESPDFAMGAKSDMPKTTSVMSGGFDVSAFHMLSAWEAMVSLTTGVVAEKYWKIGK
jgi:hypothetical protein